MEKIHQPGEKIANRYLIIDFLGQGGTGITYQAEDLQSQQTVALKVVSLKQVDNWKILELFEREAKTLASLHHTAIPKYIDYFHLETADNLHFYLIQELIPGKSLATLVEQGWHVQEKQAKQIAIQVLKILDYLHRLTPPIIHRDIKPQNILIDANQKIYLVDFGAVQNVYRNTKSFGATCVGTFGYMPPEQFRGKTFFASDLYSLGATILFLLTHRSPSELPQKRMKIDFRNCVSISEEFAAWLDKTIEPALEDRFHSAVEALKGIQTKNQNNSSSPTVKSSVIPDKAKPFDSKILLQRTDSTLIVKIPAAGFIFPNIVAILVTISIDYFILLFNFKLFSGNPTMPTGLGGFIIFLLINFSGILCIFITLWKIFGYITISIEPKIFWITWKLFRFKHRFCGQTANIQQIEVVRGRDSKGNFNYHCALWHGTKQYNFGHNLTTVEQTWLVDEILDFLSHAINLMY